MGKPFTKDYQPAKRGRAFKTLLLESIREQSLLDVPENASDEKVQKAYIGHMAQRAFDPSDPNSSTILKEVINKTFPSLKSALPEYSFDLPEDSTPAQKASAVFEAIAEGNIPPDVGNMLIQAAKGFVDIEAGTELKERLEKIEALLVGTGG